MTRIKTRILVLLVLAAPAGLLADDKKDKQDKKDPPEMVVEAFDSKTRGALQVTSVSKKPGDWFNVLQKDKNVLSGNPPLLGSSVTLDPGSYVVRVNRTERKVEIEVGKKVILRTGELVVEGKPEGTFWVPKQGKENKLVSNPPVLNTGVALFAGKYTVLVNAGAAPTEMKDIGTAEVKAGEKTVVQFK